MRILLTGDIHLRDKPPGSCTEEYLPELFLHLSRIGMMTTVDAIVFAGDIFDNKIPVRNSHKLIQRTLQILQTYQKPLYILPGNHDMTADQFDSVLETQPLGVLYRSGAAKLLSGWSDDPRWRGVSYDDINGPSEFLPIYGVPWLPEWDHEDSPEREAAVSDALEGLDTADMERFGPVLVVAHAPFFPPGQESPYENYSTRRFASHLHRTYSGPKSVFYGHIHEPHGIYDVDGVQFANAGALSRGSLHEYNINRPIQLTVWDSDTGRFEIFEIPHLPASQIFKLEEVVEKKENKMELDNFLSQVGRTTLEVSNTESIVEYSRSKGVDQRVIKVIKDLLDEVKR